MKNIRTLLACLFVFALLVGSGQSVREAYVWLTAPAIQPDRDNDMPPLENIDVAYSLRIATAPLGTSAVWLVCSGDATIRMVLHTGLPIEETFLRKGLHENVRLHASRSDADQAAALVGADSLEIGDVTLQRTDAGDVVVTPPLEPGAVSFFLRSPAPQRRDRLRISLMETGTNLRWNAGVAASTFVDRCNAADDEKDRVVDEHAQSPTPPVRA